MNKKLGESIELLFQYEAIQRDLRPAKPSTEAHYDVIIDNNIEFFKCQIKATFAIGADRKTYRVRLYKGYDKRLYEKGDLDIFVFYVAPQNHWYFVPFSEVEGKSSIALLQSGFGTYSKWRGRWDIFVSSSKTSDQFSGQGVK